MLSSVNWDNFIISANDEVYERAAGSMSNVSTLIISLIVIVVIISIAVIILLLSMWMRSRQKEIGIFLAIGISKRSILIQYLFEVFLISLAAFPLAYLFSKGVAGGLGTLFGKTMDSVIVTPGYLAVTAGVGTAILAVSVLISCLPVMRYQPKEILARME